MSAVDATSRYVTADFKTSPLIALADLLGLKRFAAQIRSSPDFYGPILSGIVLLPPLVYGRQMQNQSRHYL